MSMLNPMDHQYCRQRSGANPTGLRLESCAASTTNSLLHSTLDSMLQGQQNSGLDKVLPTRTRWYAPAPRWPQPLAIVMNVSNDLSYGTNGFRPPKLLIGLLEKPWASTSRSFDGRCRIKRQR